MALVNEMNVCELTPVPCAGMNLRRRLVGADDDDLRVARRLDHRHDEVVVADAVDDDRVEIDELLDVLRPRLIVAGVDLARQDRPHLVARQVADDVLRPRVVRMQRDADLRADASIVPPPIRTGRGRSCKEDQIANSDRWEKCSFIRVWEERVGLAELEIPVSTPGFAVAR